MAAFEVIALDTATPQLRAPGAADTYTFPRAVEMPLGTANGVLYLNGSKVVTSGSGLTFDGSNFVNGAATAAYSSAGRAVIEANGSSQALYGFRTGGTARGYLLHDGTNLLISNDVNGGTLQFTIFGAEQMRLTSTGLGIGTNNPGAFSGKVVAVQGSTSQVGLVSVSSSSGATDYAKISFYHPGNDSFELHGGVIGLKFMQSGTVQRMFLDSSGNLGLGVTPSAWQSTRKALQVGSVSSLHNISGNTFVGTNFYSDGTSKYITTGPALLYGQESDGAHKWYTAPSGTAGNAISFTQAMTLDASGRLLVGRTSSTGDNERFQIDANGTSTIYTALFGNTGTATSTYNVVRWIQGATGSATGYIGTGGSAVGNPAFQNAFVVGTQTSNRLVFNTADTEKAHIPAAGGMVVGTAALATNATDGFLYVPTCAGTPTGTPTTQTGTAPIVINTTNNKLYFYSGGAWRDAGP